jgi:hypothetical protein
MAFILLTIEAAVCRFPKKEISLINMDISENATIQNTTFKKFQK